MHGTLTVGTSTTIQQGDNLSSLVRCIFDGCFFHVLRHIVCRILLLSKLRICICCPVDGLISGRRLFSYIMCFSTGCCFFSFIFEALNLFLRLFNVLHRQSVSIIFMLVVYQTYLLRLGVLLALPLVFPLPQLLQHFRNTTLGHRGLHTNLREILNHTDTEVEFAF